MLFQFNASQLSPLWLIDRPLFAGVQPRQDPGGTLRMNGFGEREMTRETSLDRAKSARERERDTRWGVQSLAESGNALFLP